jgi:hypothetical protein
MTLPSCSCPSRLPTHVDPNNEGFIFLRNFGEAAPSAHEISTNIIKGNVHQVTEPREVLGKRLCSCIFLPNSSDSACAVMPIGRFIMHGKRGGIVIITWHICICIYLQCDYRIWKLVVTVNFVIAVRG